MRYSNQTITLSVVILMPKLATTIVLKPTYVLSMRSPKAKLIIAVSQIMTSTVHMMIIVELPTRRTTIHTIITVICSITTYEVSYNSNKSNEDECSVYVPDWPTNNIMIVNKSIDPPRCIKL